MSLVTTILGTLDDAELEHSMQEEDSGDVIVVAREWKYKGSDPKFAEHVGTVVRRDVWATIKCGQAAQAVSDL